MTKKSSLAACLLLAACSNSDRPADTIVQPSAMPAADVAGASRAPVQGALLQSPFDKMDRSPLRLAAGQALTASLPAPRQGELAAIGVHIGNYRDASDGLFSVEVCNLADCRRADVPLAGTTDNRFVMAPLPEVLAVEEGNPLTFAFRRKDGGKPFAIWTYGPVTGSASVTGIDGGSMDRTIRIGMQYAD